jgi:hypothetical protein
MQKLHFLMLILLGLFQATFAQESKPFRTILWETPADLSTQTLLVPMYENRVLDEGEQSLYKEDKQFRAQVLRFNELVKEQNQNISTELEKSYKGKYKLVKLSEVDSLSKKGYKYYLDLIIMPKQFHEPEQKALVASYRAHETGSTMFNNYDAQFNYYFYIRNIQTDDVYLSKEFKGNFFLYDAMSDFLKRVRKELKK